MRVASLISVAVMAGLLAGCGAESSRAVPQEETTAAAPATERDLTLQAPVAPAVEVASPVELTRPVATPRPRSRPRVSPEPAQAPGSEPENPAVPVTGARGVTETLAPAAEGPAAVLPVVSPSAPTVEPPLEEAAVGAGRELAPGKTVTVIPASSGPSVEAEDADSWLPSERPRGLIGGGGGTCRPRGGVRGTGIAGRIPVGVPARRLR